jgi:arylsulfatase A-like enzyme
MAWCRSRSVFLVLGAALLFCVGCTRSPDPASKNDSASTAPKRVVLIVVDTLRQDFVGVYGGQVETPNMDGLAQRGQMLPRAVSSFSQTTMSMGALFTGRTPSIESGDTRESLGWTEHSWCGLSRFASTESAPCVPTEVETLAERLGEAGYETLGVAANLLLYAPSGFEQGFDIWKEPGQRTTESPLAYERRDRIERGAYGGTLAPSVISAVREALDERKSDRFFLYVHFMDVHDFAPSGMTYRQSVAAADVGVGELLELLEGRGLLDDSLIVLTSDHGERFDEKHPIPGRQQHFGNPAFEYLLRVPLIIVPKLLKDSNQLIRGQDLAAILLRAVGAPLPTPSELDGEEVFLSEYRWRTLRKGRWKAMFRRTGGISLLFDLQEDPQEKRNRARRHPEILERMRVRVAELTTRLATGVPGSDLDEKDIARLRAIGYLEMLEDPQASPTSAEEKPANFSRRPR